MNASHTAPLLRRPVSRRGLVGAGAALGLGGLLAACGGESESGPDGKRDPWRFKDDRGTTAEADGTPKRIVAYVGAAAALHDLGVDCVGVFGPTKRKDGEPDVQAGRLDVDKLTVIGNTWGEFNVEKYASLRPDLLVSTMNVAPDLWYVPDDSTKEVATLAPTVGILTGKGSLTGVIGRFQELAASLGADLSAGPVTDAKARFEAASEKLRRAAKARRGLRVMAVSAQSDLFYVGNPGDFTDLRYYRKLGVEFVVPEKTLKGGFFQELSWERVDRYGADVLLVDKRTGNLQPDALKRTKPTWAELPAVTSGQVAGWFNEAQFSYAGYAPLIESLAATLEGAKKVR